MLRWENFTASYVEIHLESLSCNKSHSTELFDSKESVIIFRIWQNEVSLMIIYRWDSISQVISNLIEVTLRSYHWGSQRCCKIRSAIQLHVVLGVIRVVGRICHETLLDLDIVEFQSLVDVFILGDVLKFKLSCS